MPPEQLEITVSDQKKNQLLDRSELIVQVKHLGMPTPDRQTLRKEVGRVQKASADQVYIQKIVTDYGAGISEVHANVYKTAKQGEESEAEYLRKRNAPPEAKKEAAAPAPTPATPTTPPLETPAPVKEAPVKAEKEEAETAKPKAPKKPAKEKTVEATPAEAASVPQAESKEIVKPKGQKEKPAKEKAAEEKSAEPDKKES